MLELMKAVGQQGYIRTENGLNVDVTVLDVKMSYGKVRYQVTPVAGIGQTWVENVWGLAPTTDPNAA